jgi:hypothetical protein
LGVRSSAIAERRESNRDDAAHEREQEALGEQLTNDPAAAGTDRQTDRDLPFARRGSSEQEVGHVRAGDQQHQADRRHQHEQRLLKSLPEERPTRAAGTDLDARREEAPANVRSIGRRHGIDKLRPHDRETRLGLRRRDVWVRPRQHPEPRVSDGKQTRLLGQQLRQDRQGQRDVRGLSNRHAGEPGRAHADNRHRNAFDQDSLADDP